MIRFTTKEANMAKRTTEVTIVETEFHVEEVSVDIARQEMASSFASTYGATERYAGVISAQILETFWMYEEGDKDLPEAKAVFVEKKACYKALKEAGHSNPSVVWARIRKHGEALYKAQYSNSQGGEGGEGGEGEGEGESAIAGNNKRSDAMFAFEESLKIVKRMAKSEDAKYTEYGLALARLMSEHLNVEV
jgi:thymidylate synthase ThyX